ncbi:uncharacterized protein LOC129743602 [Uranotaenia lowii]|uniref:uncharacterized protein LOC129743602 n=1 Tax=Uranotaenia lowii TaxID=190385 RepID=UPI0024784C0E|nr:uncharacterized protein LOC129743602 [Uranotaenia lowii]
MITTFVLSLLPLVVLANYEECISVTPGTKMDQCCLVPSGLPKEVLEDCLETAAMNQVPNREARNSIICGYECFMRKIGVVVNQTIYIDKVEEYMAKLEPIARDSRIAAWKICFVNRLNLVAKAKMHPFLCYPFAYAVHYCVRAMVDQNCPPEYFNDTEMCRKIRAGVPFCKSPE